MERKSDELKALLLEDVEAFKKRLDESGYVVISRDYIAVKDKYGLNNTKVWPRAGIKANMIEIFATKQEAWDRSYECKDLRNMNGWIYMRPQRATTYFAQEIGRIKALISVIDNCKI